MKYEARAYFGGNVSRFPLDNAQTVMLNAESFPEIDRRWFYYFGWSVASNVAK